MKRIVILLHERDRAAERRNYVIWGLRDRWRERGIDVRVVRGTANVPDADLLIPHLDVTVMPDDYQRLLDGHRWALNRRVRDISKSVISSCLVHPGDGWTGPVIVKTNRNCGGRPDSLIEDQGIRSLGGLLRRGTRFLLTGTHHHPSDDYAVLPSILDVPPRFLENDGYVVERFLPEMDGDLYCLRVYTFCGTRHVCARRRSPEPIVKAAASPQREDVDVPAAIAAARERLGFDYGKFDFVVRDEGPVLFDVNRTPTYVGNRLTAAQRQRAAWLADGIL